MERIEPKAILGEWKMKDVREKSSLNKTLECHSCAKSARNDGWSDNGRTIHTYYEGRP